jgi:hypothetical protein
MNPVLITVDTTDYPVDNLPFPAVTLCRENNDPNRFHLASKVLDHLAWPCYNRGVDLGGNMSYVKTI